jgi:hypothetical protein
MILPQQSPPITRRPSPLATPRHTIVTTPDGRRLTLLCAIHRGESLHHNSLRSMRNC